MVYAVIMNTVSNFEKAIGRKVMWGTGLWDSEKNSFGFTPQLMVYPHALRDVNAYYSSERKALLFGYFNATPADVDLHMPGSLVFSCLSHDIVAHETTHAILDGIFRHYMEPTHPDVGAFHEGFADIVALFQHFTFAEALKNQIARSRGRFNAENLLGQLAVEFGKASGYYHSLRDAIGKEDEETGAWRPIKPDAGKIKTDFEPHDRGSILVAVIFDAFISIYNHRTADLVRIASNGTGILPEGRLNTDLVNRLADEAAKTASHVLNMCIRALDYYPPMDIHFGDYLRALVTADADLIKNDDRNYRIAFIDAFRRWGIYPENISILSEETLIYSVDHLTKELNIFKNGMGDFLRSFKNEIGYEKNRQKIFDKTIDLIKGSKKSGAIRGLHQYIYDTATSSSANMAAVEKLTGLIFSAGYKQMNMGTSRAYGAGPAVEIHSVRLNNRVSPDGNIQNEAIITLVQRCGVKVVYDESNDKYDITTFALNSRREYEEGCFIFRGGCTLIFDLNNDVLKHVISKPIFDVAENNKRRSRYKPDYNRVVMQYRSQWGDFAEMTGFAAGRNNPEYFSHIHQVNNDHHE
jgi:hypothetical protein